MTGRIYSAQPRTFRPGWGVALILLLGGLLFGPGTIQAQESSGEHIQEFIARNAELLDWARGLVGETESQPARRVLEEAYNLHRRSVGMLEQGRPVLAFSAARRSRAGLWRAVGLAREALSYEERLRLRSERFQDLHAHLQESARESQDRRALDFIQRAGAQALRAREQYQQGDARLAFNLLEKAEQLLQRAARLLAEGAGPERLERNLEQTASMLEQTREILGSSADQAALNLLAEADEALDRARDHQDQGQPGRALQMSGLARKLAGRARAESEGFPDEALVREQMTRWDDRVIVVGEQVAESGNEMARHHLEKARQHRERAGEALAAGQLEKALRQIRAAGDQLSQAEGLTR
jgi:hypothetical protein